MQFIQTITVGATPTGTITFSAIPQTMTDLYLTISARASNTSNQFFIYFNSAVIGYDAQVAGSYANNAVYGSSGSIEAGWMAQSDYDTNVFGDSSIYIPNYTVAGSHTWYGEGGGEKSNSTASKGFVAGYYSDPAAAITSLKIHSNGNFNFITGSTFSLYGITKGSGGANVA